MDGVQQHRMRTVAVDGVMDDAVVKLDDNKPSFVGFVFQLDRLRGAIVTFNGLDLIVQKFKQVIKVGDVKPVRSGEHLGHTIINPQLTRAYVAIPVARDTAFVLVKSTVIVTDLEVVLCECHKCVVLGYGIAKSTGKASSVVGL